MLFRDFAEEDDEQLATLAQSVDSRKTMRRDRRIKEWAENPEQLQCKPIRLCFRVPRQVRLCLIIGIFKAAESSP